MTNFLVVLCSCADEKEAEDIGRQLVERRLAACATVSGPVRSIYWWQGQVETAAESLLLVKTAADKFDDVKNAIQSLHSYEVPEVLALPVEAVGEKYGDWLNFSLSMP